MWFLSLEYSERRRDRSFFLLLHLCLGTQLFCSITLVIKILNPVSVSSLLQRLKSEICFSVWDIRLFLRLTFKNQGSCLPTFLLSPALGKHPWWRHRPGQAGTLTPYVNSWCHLSVLPGLLELWSCVFLWLRVPYRKASQVFIRPSAQCQPHNRCSVNTCYELSRIGLDYSTTGEGGFWVCFLSETDLRQP